MLTDRQIVEPGEMLLHPEKAMRVKLKPQVTAENNKFVSLPFTSVPGNPEKPHTLLKKSFHFQKQCYV